MTRALTAVVALTTLATSACATGDESTNLRTTAAPHPLPRVEHPDGPEQPAVTGHAIALVELDLARQARERAARTRTPTGSEGPRASGTVAIPPQRDLASILACIRHYESRGDYTAESAAGHSGAYQFAIGTWRGAVARAGYPEWSDRRPSQAPPAVQDAAAAQLYRERGLQPWPTPSRRCA